MNSTENLRLIFTTQSIGVELFWRLQKALMEEGELGCCGFFVTNRYEYSLFEKNNPEFCRTNQDTLKEWDLMSRAKELPAPDLKSIEEWEKSIGDATLWNAVIIDRRMNYGLKAQFVQSYAPSYDHDSLLKILQVALEGISAQFDRVRPHAVIGLNAVTLYDYLYYLMARQRGVPYFQLKLTRVRNYVSLFTDPFDLSPHIVSAYERLLIGKGLDAADQAALIDARALLDEVRGKTLVYEGAIKRPAGTGTHQRQVGKSGGIPLMKRMAAWYARLVSSASIRDPHYPTLIHSVYYTKVVRRLRRKFLRVAFDIVHDDAFVKTYAGRYAVYPLNTEPEVALLAFGRPYRNQIETVRNIAASLPVGWKLVVKEHPNAYGYRSAGYYRKLKQIPNVVLAGPTADTGRLTDGCGLLVLVYGTIGLEAIIKGKPTVILCETPFGVFPHTMVRYVDKLWQLGREIRELLDGHRHDEGQVAAFIAAHVRTGIRLNLFTGLLSKGGRETGDMDTSIQEQYASLARYARTRIAEETARLNGSRNVNIDARG